MPDRHAHGPVTVRLSAGPDGDRAWVLAYAEHAGMTAESEPATIRAVIMLAVADFRARRDLEITAARERTAELFARSGDENWLGI